MHVGHLVSNMLLRADASSSLYSDVQKRTAGDPVDSLALALEEQLSYDRDSDSVTTSPSTSSLDTCSSHRIYQVLSKCEGSRSHQDTSVTAEVLEGSECRGFAEPEACSSEKSKIPRSVTDGELKQRIPNPLGQHGVSSGGVFSPPRLKHPPRIDNKELCLLFLDRGLAALGDLT